MRTENIGKQDQWARFMQLSNAARNRNQGLAGESGGIGKSAAARPVTNSTRSEFQVKPASSTGLGLLGKTYTTAAVQNRILGGTFDAYA